MRELKKILDARATRGRTLHFQELIREHLDKNRFVPSRPADKAMTVVVAKDGTPTRVTIRALKRSISSEPTFTQTRTRVVHYDGLPESDDTRRGLHRGSSDVVTETRRELDDLPDDVKAEAMELASGLDDQLRKAWADSLQSFLDYYSPEDWEDLKDDIPDLDVKKAREELELLIDQ